MSMSDTICPGVTGTVGNIQSIANTHIGAVRTVNEDRVLNCPDQGLWAVADGMGGHSKGDRAAMTVVRALADLATGSVVIGREEIADALMRANATVFTDASDAGRTCGSTVAGLHINGGRCMVFWAGDSRVYRLRSGSLTQMTHDHRLVLEMVDAGVLTVAQARDHYQANIITRAIGVGANAMVEFLEDHACEGDLYLICSDGLSDMINDRQIDDALKLNLSQSAERLVKAALNSGGKDNISLVLISLSQKAD